MSACGEVEAYDLRLSAAAHPEALGAIAPTNRRTWRIEDMRTILFLVSGLLLMSSFLIVAKLFSEHFPSAPNWALALGLGLWLAVTGSNMWIGVAKAGYSVAEELPILALLFLMPAVAAILVRWRFL